MKKNDAAKAGEELSNEQKEKALNLMEGIAAVLRQGSREVGLTLVVRSTFPDKSQRVMVIASNREFDVEDK